MNHKDATPSVDIVIPTYNSENYIQATLESVRNQSFENLTIIVVDGGSSDNTCAIIRNFQSKDIRVKLLINKNDQGPAHSRHVAIGYGTGEFVAFLDSDDLWNKNKLKLQIDYMQKHNLDFTFTDYEKIDHNGAIISRVQCGHNTNSYEQYLRRRGIANSTVVVRRSIIGDVWSMAIKPTYAEDTLWWLLLMRERKILSVRVPVNLMQYRVLSTARSSNLIQNQFCVWTIYRQNLQLGLLSTIRNYASYISDVFYRKIFRKQA